MSYKVVKKSKNKIRCVRDEDSGKEITPEELALSDKLSNINVKILSEALDVQLNPVPKVKLFDFLKDINFERNNLIEGNEKVYVPFIINKWLAQSRDCIFQANEMNIRAGLENSIQYKYLCNSIRKKKRFAKAHKSKNEEDVLIVAELENVSTRKAQQLLDVIYSEIDDLPKHYKEEYKLR